VKRTSYKLAGGLVVFGWLVYLMMPFHELQEGSLYSLPRGLVRASLIRGSEQKKVE
jgi:hypothetical protein